MKKKLGMLIIEIVILTLIMAPAVYAGVPNRPTSQASPYPDGYFSCFHKGAIPQYGAIDAVRGYTTESRSPSIKAETEIGLMVGLRYSFKRFRIHSPSRHLATLIKNFGKILTGGVQSVSLYVDVF